MCAELKTPAPAPSPSLQQTSVLSKQRAEEWTQKVICPSSQLDCFTCCLGFFLFDFSFYFMLLTLYFILEYSPLTML